MKGEELKARVHLSQERLDAFAAGVATPDAGESAHLRECPYCAASLARLRDDLRHLGEVAQQRALLPRCPVRLPAARVEPARKNVFGWSGGLAAAAACVLLVFWLGQERTRAPLVPEPVASGHDMVSGTPGAGRDSKSLPPALQHLLEQDVADMLARDEVGRENLANDAWLMVAIDDIVDYPLPDFVLDVIDDHGESLESGGDGSLLETLDPLTDNGVFS